MTADVLDALPLAGELVSAGELPAPGSYRTALYRPDAPGAVLDREPWARSWASFLAAVLGEDGSARQVIANAMGERVPAEGGFLVPEYLRSQVLSYVTPAIMRPRAMVLPMASLKLPVPTLDNPSQASGAQALGGMTFALTEAGAVIPATAPTFGRTVLEARKIAGLVNVPDELADDGAGAFGDFLARVIGEGYAWYEDDLFIGAAGTGVGGPQSVINAPCAVPVARNTSSEVLFPDVVAMFKALHPASKQVGLTSGVTDVVWLLSASAMDQLLELNYQVTVGSVTTPIAPPGWFDMGDGHDIAPSMLGLPAIVTDHQPAVGTPGDVVLADLRHYLIGDRMEMVVERSGKGTGFVTGTSNFRVKGRMDGRYWIQSASTTEAGQQVSPVVVLH